MQGTPDLTTSWLNFAQQPVDQGGLGLAPHQAAGLVGNLVNESGQSLTPWGATGDNGTAQGTAQWRGDRLDALKASYPDTYQTPQAQQAFMRDEFLGSENKAYKALLASKSPEEAATAVNHLYERSADTSGNREAAARNLMKQFGPGAVGALSLANEDDSDEDKGAVATNNVIGSGALTPQRLLSGPKEDDRLQKLAQGLTGIGASLASISSPQQSYALNQQLQSMKKDNEGKYKVMVTKDGRILRVDQDGNVDSVGGNTATGSTAPPPIGDMTKTGAEYLKTVPVTQQGLIQQMVEGTLPAPSPYKMGTPEVQSLIAAAHQYDPTFDATVWSGRNAGAKDWATGGKSADIAKSLNQSIGHLSDLPSKFDALNNGQSPLLNEAGNYFNTKVLGQTGVTGFKLNAHAVADEMGKLFKGAGLSDREIKQWEEGLGENMSPDQQKEAMGTLSGLVRHSMSALEEKRRQAIGDVAASKKGALLDADASKALDLIDNWTPRNATKKSAPADNTNTFKTQSGKTINWSVN